MYADTKVRPEEANNRGCCLVVAGIPLPEPRVFQTLEGGAHLGRGDRIDEPGSACQGVKR